MKQELVNKELRYDALKTQWIYLLELENDYERRISSVAFTTLFALEAAIVAFYSLSIDVTNQSKIEIGIPIKTTVVIMFPLILYAIIGWMSCNFRRQAMAENYLKHIEAELNNYVGGNEKDTITVFGWEKYYYTYHEKKTIVNPRNNFIAFCGLVYVISLIACFYFMWTNMQWAVLLKIGYISIYLLAGIILYCTLDNSKVRTEDVKEIVKMM